MPGVELGRVIEVGAQESGSEMPEGERLLTEKPAERGETPKDEPVAEVEVVMAERSLTGPGKEPSWVSRREGLSDASEGNW